MRKFIVAAGLALLAVAGVTTKASAENVSFSMQDSTDHDYIIVSPGAPEGSAEATDLLSVRYVINSEPTKGPKMLRITYHFTHLDIDFGYHFDEIVRTPSGKVGQIYSDGRGYVNMRKTLDGEAFYCPQSGTRVNWERNTVTQHVAFWCLPYRHLAFSPSVTTYYDAGKSGQQQAAFDAMPPPGFTDTYSFMKKDS